MDQLVDLIFRVSSWIRDTVQSVYGLSLHYLESLGVCDGRGCLKYQIGIPTLVIIFLVIIRGRLLPRVRGAGSFRNLSWFDMERLAKEYYQDLGYKVDSTKSGADNGVDLFVEKKGVMAVVQVKHYKKNVGIPVVREIVGVLADHPKCKEAHVVVSSSFTKPARDYAKKHGVRLVDGKKILLKN